MKRTLLSIVMLMLVAGCGGGGGGGDQAPGALDWQGPLNAAGYPKVEAVYSFITGERSYTCGDDPVVRTLPGITMGLEIQQAEDQLFAFNQEAMTDPDIIITEYTDLAGSIAHDGSFFLAQTVQYTVSGFEGTFTVENKLEGRFSVSGWSGDYKYTTMNELLQLACNYSSSFSGERFATGARATTYGLLSPATDDFPAWKLLGH